jgi:sterol desaturase/sphingolipid hydroxylase (fatty acid hydroxylase superfamily)
MKKHSCISAATVPGAGPPSPAPRSVRQLLATIVRHGFYPVALALTLLFIFFETQGFFGPLGKAYPVYLALMIGTLVLLEWWVPVRPEWSMTGRRFFRRDLPMLLVNGAAVAATTSAVTAIAHGAAFWPVKESHTLPWWAQAIAAILISDFIWYWVHRYSHEGRGRWSQWLWRTHVLHHLPEQVYVFMHVVGHPINGAYVRVILMLPPITLGFSPQAIFAAAALTGFQGLVSHFNVDIRAGWLNRVFMGTELHRYHHSADPKEGRNYAAVVTFWDQLFGTYEHHLGEQPLALGLRDRAAYPADGLWGAWLALPFKGNSRQKTDG